MLSFDLNFFDLFWYIFIRIWRFNLLLNFIFPNLYLKNHLILLLIMMIWIFFYLIKQSIHLINQPWFHYIHWNLAFRLFICTFSVQGVELIVALGAYQETLTLHVTALVVLTGDVYFYWGLKFILLCMVIWYWNFCFFLYFHDFLLYQGL